MDVATIAPRDLNARREQGQPVDSIDVRTPVEFREVHADVARNVPLAVLDPKAVLAERNCSGHQPLYIICRSGSRGQQACLQFLAAGFTQVINVEGGTHAWVDAGLPVVRGKPAMALERQVRIAAGSLVLLGAVLGWLVDPVFIGLAAIVGTGLIFAGITDTCSMGMLLARMPWNQVSEPGSCSAER